jgi:hypothetical protein
MSNVRQPVLGKNEREVLRVLSRGGTAATSEFRITGPLQVLRRLESKGLVRCGGSVPARFKNATVLVWEITDAARAEACVGQWSRRSGRSSSTRASRTPTTATGISTA